MSVTAIFIDGPLDEEVKRIERPMKVFRVPLPERVTICQCYEYEEFIKPPEVFQYYCIAFGPEIAIYSKYESGDSVVKSLRSWVHTDLSVGRLTVSCRDRRAFE